ncbi:MAG: tetratricopeptide repeat protein [Gammaproteobacteria bacterium]|nr:tetratricopeptide repeat protein [Gammaproteobacteria bacterium]
MSLNIDHTEEEQVEALKRWWKNYGPSIVVGVVLGGSLIAGNKWWQSHKLEQAESGSAVYAQVLRAYESRDINRARDLAADLVSKHSGSAYSDLANLLLARIAFDAGEKDKAAGHLEAAMNSTYDNGVKNAARLRLARVLEAGGDTDKALAVIADATGISGFEADYAELRGDLMLSRGDRGAARAAYTEAVKHASSNPEYMRIVKMKLANLGAN